MQNLNKNGMISIIQISFLTMLSVIALSLIWGYVSDLSSDFENQLSPAVDCIAQKSKISNTCVNNEGKIELNLNIGVGEEINYLSANYLGESFICGQTCSSCNIKEEQGKKTIYLDSQVQVNVGDKIAVTINKCNPEVLVINNC